VRAEAKVGLPALFALYLTLSLPPSPQPRHPRSPSPQILASIASAVRAFIKGGGLKRLLEAVTPRTAHAPTLARPRNARVFPSIAECLCLHRQQSAAVPQCTCPPRSGGSASGFASLHTAQRQRAEPQECALRATPPLLRGIDALVFCAQQTMAAFPSRGSAQFAEDEFKRLWGGKD
jgi:hypothetical protein